MGNVQYVMIMHLQHSKQCYLHDIEFNVVSNSVRGREWREDGGIAVVGPPDIYFSSRSPRSKINR